MAPCGPADPLRRTVVGAHRHSSNHREKIARSELCGCFHCRETFSPSAIREWVDEVGEVGTTALCPRCGVDSVLGSASGCPLSDEFLTEMNRYWFS